MKPRNIKILNVLFWFICASLHTYNYNGVKFSDYSKLDVGISVLFLFYTSFLFQFKIRDFKQ